MFSNISLNESPSEKEGKSPTLIQAPHLTSASMKVPPKRKGNFWVACCSSVFSAWPQ